MVQWDEVLLDRDSPDPLYLQIGAQIRERIARGDLSPGEKLPPTRELASVLRINRNTIASAYEELAKTGVVRSHVGQGTFVAEGPNRPNRPNRPDRPNRDDRRQLRYRFSRAVEASASRVRPPSSLPGGSPEVIDFASLVPDEELFPVEPFRRVLDRVLRREGKKLLQYGPAAGHPPLRSYIADRLRRRGVAADPENVLIVNGSQQALDLVARSFLDPGDRVVVESPTYTIVLPLLAQYHAQIDPVPMTDRGMDLGALETALERSPPKLIFTMPTFHNPTGITMDLETRRGLLELARRYGTPVVEDDFDSDLRFDGDALPPLKALDSRDAVIHIGTFSKGLFPGVRLGFIVAPREVVETLGRSKLISDYHTSLLLQAAVYEFCRAGHYDRHLKRLAGIYREKSRALTRALERFFPPGVGWTRPEGGYAYWITLPEGLSAEEVFEQSVKEGVAFTPGSFFFARGDGDRFLRLSISRVPLARIEEGIEKLGRVLARCGRERVEKRARAMEHEPAFHI